MTKGMFGVLTNKGRVVSKSTLERFATKESRQLKDPFQESYQTHGLVAPLYNPHALAGLMEMNTYHARAVRTKARDTAGLGWDLKPMRDDASESQKEAVEDFIENMEDPLHMVLERMFVDYEAIGFGALEAVRNEAGELTDLKHIPSWTLRVHRDKERYVQQRGSMRVWFKAIGLEDDVDYETGTVRAQGSIAPERRANELIFIRQYCPRSDYYGIPDVIPSIGAIEGDISRREFNTAFFDNYGVPSALVFISGNYDPGEIDEDGRSEIEKAIEEQVQEMNDNPFSTMILGVQTGTGEGEVNIDFQPLSTDVKEASFRLFRKDNRDEILASHGIPPYRMGIAETGSLGGSTAEESTEIYKRSIIEPRQESVEQLINKWVVWGEFEAWEWKFRLADIDTTDEEHELRMVQALFDMGAITPNQIISHFGEKYGLEPEDHPLMDAHYIRGNPVEVEDSDTLQMAAMRLKSALKRESDGEHRH